jgi:hypothetical protein
MTTILVNNNCIIINLEKIEEDIFSDADKQTIVFIANSLVGLHINETNRTITLFLSIKGNYSYHIDFDRGGINSDIAQRNFDSAKILLGNLIISMGSKIV